MLLGPISSRASFVTKYLYWECVSGLLYGMQILLFLVAFTKLRY